MEFLITKNNLKKALFTVSHISGKNVNLPILNNVMIKIEDKNIKLITTDLEIGITHSMRGKIEKEGIFTVNSKVFYDYINLLPDKKIKIKQKEDSLEIECDNYKTKIKGQSAEDFPLIPEVETKNSYKINIKDFKKALSKVVFSTASSESRIELTGILFTIEKDELTMASTDSYRLSEKKIKIENRNNEEKSVIIPSKTIQEVLRILSNFGEGDELDQGQDMNIFISDSQVLFKTEKTELVSRLIEGQYPDYKQIIPKESKTKSILNRYEFLQAVKTSSLFSKTGINDISIDFPKDKNQTIISSVSGQTGENVVEIDSQTKGDDNSIVVNYQYLLDGLKNIEDDEVEISIVDNNTPCIVKPIKEDNYLYIIMPIKQ